MAIKMYVEDEHQQEWDCYVPRLELALSRSVNLMYKQSSFYLVHGGHARTMLDAMVPPGQGARIFSVVHVSRLKRFINKVVRPTHVPSAEPLVNFDEALLPEDSWEANESAREYEVESILDDKFERKSRRGRFKKSYMVKWKGYAEPSCVDVNDLSCSVLLYA
ncbi:TPA: hypothetical protein N0F65_004190 [Lagenidium giganteum]|uniref:Chromo domain-containing protein n=1 Tax=Lagenidium giganteum TaxID=4803 RepID=A0AAV2YLC5_9STRA|nr:TPA: hypothetical protein N0F65_004190 [Lagenidium giganteum]